MLLMAKDASSFPREHEMHDFYEILKQGEKLQRADEP